MAQKTKAITAHCPECDARLTFKKMPDLEQLVTCHECGELLEVVDTKPLTLDWTDNFEDDSYDDEDGDWN